MKRNKSTSNIFIIVYNLVGNEIIYLSYKTIFDKNNIQCLSLDSLTNKLILIIKYKQKCKVFWRTCLIKCRYMDIFLRSSDHTISVKSELIKLYFVFLHQPTNYIYTSVKLFMELLKPQEAFAIVFSSCK